MLQPALVWLTVEQLAEIVQAGRRLERLAFELQQRSEEPVLAAFLWSQYEDIQAATRHAQGQAKEGAA